MKDVTIFGPDDEEQFNDPDEVWARDKNILTYQRYKDGFGILLLWNSDDCGDEDATGYHYEFRIIYKGELYRSYAVHWDYEGAESSAKQHCDAILEQEQQAKGI